MGRGLSITAFVLSLLFFIPFASFIGVILGIIAVMKAKDKKDLKGLAIAAIAIGSFFLILSIIIYIFFPIYNQEPKINSLSAHSAMPTGILGLDITLSKSLANGTIKVRFSDDNNYKVDVPLFYDNEQAAIVSVPIYFTDTGNFTSGIVDVMVVVDSGDKEYISNKITGFEIKNLPTVKEQPGTITLAYLTNMIEASDSIIGKLAQVDINDVSTDELQQELVNQRDSLVSFKEHVNSAMQNSANAYVFGNFNGKELKLDKETLGLSDRIIAGYLLQYQQTSGITGNVVLTGSDVTLDSLGDSFTNMFQNMKQGIRANGDKMASVGSTMVNVGTAMSILGGPTGLAVGLPIAGLGAIVWFTGLHTETAFNLAIDASISSALDPNSNSVQQTVENYFDKLIPRGTSTWAGETGTLAGSMYDFISSIKDLMDLTDEFNKDADKSEGKTSPEENTYLLMVSKQGDGAGTIMSYPPGISCPGKCTQLYQKGTKVTLGARVDSPDSSFAGWQGICSGTGDCIIFLEKDTAIIGTFNKQQAPPHPSGSGLCSSLSSSNACGPCNSKADCDGEACWTDAIPPFC